MKYQQFVRRRPPLAFIFVLLLVPHSAWAVYETNMSKAAQWLSSHQNPDGSWGASDNQTFITTLEAVQALHNASTRNSAYYRGITWLENHSVDNADYGARWALALGSVGDNVSAVTAQLQSAQNTALVGHSGWGVETNYLQSPIDTAVVLTTPGTTTNVAAATTYLKGVQLSGGAWPVGLETTGDITTTALVIKALVQTQDASLGSVIKNGVAAMAGMVNAIPAANRPVFVQALAAQAALTANSTATAQPWLANLVSIQGADGSWNTQAYDTALALQAFAAANGSASTANQTTVLVPDAALRAAINASMGRNAMDALNRADLAQLTTLSAAGLGISDLTGLQYAVNLQSIDLQNNNITSLTPIAGIPNLHMSLGGNPVGSGPHDSPTVPQWGALLLGGLLVVLMRRHARHESSVIA